MRAHVVSRATGASVAQQLGLGARLKEHAPETSPEEAERLASTPSVVGAVLEAALGALFLQHGFAAIEDAVVAAFSGQIERAVTSRVDHKSDLQEFLARSGRKASYVEVSAEGPSHDRYFTCAVLVDGQELGRGAGKAKKEAEQEAAREALTKLDAGEFS